MRIFLTGATGYIGSAVAEELVRKGHEVLVLAWNRESAEKLEEAGHEVIRGDLREALGLARGAAASDAVIHTALSRSIIGPEVDVKATSALILALEETGKPFIYTSGVWVYGDTGDEVVLEGTPLDPPAEVAWRVVAERHGFGGDRPGREFRGDPDRDRVRGGRWHSRSVQAGSPRTRRYSGRGGGGATMAVRPPSRPGLPI